MKFIKKRTNVVKKMEKLDTAIAGFVVNLNVAMIIGIATPPPPIPAMLLSAMTMENMMMPPISSPWTGKTYLWPQKPSFLLPQTSQG